LGAKTAIIDRKQKFVLAIFHTMAKKFVKFPLSNVNSETISRNLENFAKV
jgi:hypothetical protein